MTRSPGIALYNQDRFGDVEFLASFVARNEQTEALLNGLRHIVEGGSTEHQILVGTRGMGKTSLLRRLAIGIMEDPKLSANFIPLRFREEQYNIISLDAFWRNCGESLAEWCEQQGNQELADRLDIAIESSEWRDENKARDAFLSACAEVGGRPILLLDNLDLILGGIKLKGCWALRATLQRKDGPIVIGASTALLTQSAKRDAPFYEFFHPHILEPLTEQELLACLNALADHRGDAGLIVKAILAREPERVRSLYVLTGGNPRILGLIYGLLEQPDSTEIFADLEALLDQVTPFYKARIEEYQTPLQRAVIDGIALHWDPITSSVLSKQTGIEATTLSGQLNKLRKDGLIEEVRTSGSRSGYQLAERFLNIWYLMRHGTRKTKQRLRWFTIFLTKLFSVDELQRMADEARTGTKGWQAEQCEAVINAYDLKMLSAAKHALPAQKSDELFRFLENVRKLINSQKIVEAIGALEEVLGQIETEGRSTAIAMILIVRGILFRAENRHEEAIMDFDGAIERLSESSDPKMLEEVADALVLKGKSLRALGRHDEAIFTFETAIKRFGTSSNFGLQESLVTAMISQAFALGDLDRLEDAIAIFDAVEKRFGQNTETEIQDMVVTALAVKGMDLAKLGKYDHAIAILDEVDQRFGETDTLSIKQTVSRALIVKGLTYSVMGRSDLAIAAYENIIQRFENLNDADLEKSVARAFANMAELLEETGRFKEAYSTYEAMFTRFADNEWSELDKSLASALAKLLIHRFWIMGHHEEAERKLQTVSRGSPEHLPARASLFWMLIAMERLDEAQNLISQLKTIDGGGKALILAGVELGIDNFGSSLTHLTEALRLGLEGEFDFSEDLLWYLRIANERGYGEKMIEWFIESGNSERYAPVYGAFVAHVREERYLLDLNPEVRGVAQPLFAKLSAGKKLDRTRDEKKAGTKKQ